jgi:pimeloyl-ACP methyl ester carboxylesterase
MSTVKPAIIFIHGAWHGPEAFDEVIFLLRKAKYPSVSGGTLPSSGATTAYQNFDSDVQILRAAAREIVERGEECVVVMHSYGGIVGPEALQGLDRKLRKENGEERGVVCLVFLRALLLSEGESVRSSPTSQGNDEETADTSQAFQFFHLREIVTRSLGYQKIQLLASLLQWWSLSWGELGRLFTLL